MNDFPHAQTEMQASIDSQTSMMQTSSVTSGLTLMLKSLGGGARCLGMSPCLSHFVPYFSSYLVTCLVSYTAVVIMSACMGCFH
jgi:hypothetical protein